MRPIITILFSLSLIGCATHTPSPYGNFVKDPTGLNQQKIASDTIEKITELYPPAKTRFELQQPTPDEFGQALVHGFRESGYALLEFDPKTAKERPQQNTDITHTTRNPTNERKRTMAQSVDSIDANPTETGSGLPLRYIFDQFTGTTLYRVTIMIGDASLTRPYALQSGDIVPAGYWVRKG